MRYFPETESDLKEAAELNAQQWQIDLLKLNPSYCSWGCYEDYMSETKSQWGSRVIQETWQDMADWGLDELNELVNFYFEVTRESTACIHCEQTGYNPATKRLSDDWYDFAHTGRRWNTKLTDVEVLALAKSGRLFNFTDRRFHFDETKGVWMEWIDGKKIELAEMPELPTAAHVNTIESKGGLCGHDAINRHICIEARAKHLGVYGLCEHCNGNGYIYTQPQAQAALQLWFIHPRKGCSRGVYIKSIQQSDLPEIFAYLKQARDRNADRFSKIA